VLVVEDEPLSQFIARGLGDNGYRRVIVRPDGGKALARVKNQNLRYGDLDLGCPFKGGSPFCRERGSNLRFPHLDADGLDGVD